MAILLLISGLSQNTKQRQTTTLRGARVAGWIRAGAVTFTAQVYAHKVTESGRWHEHVPFNVLQANRRRWKPLADRCRTTGSDADYNATGFYDLRMLPAI